MSKLAGKIRNKATQMYADSHFSQSDIARLSGTEHNNEPMARIYAKIMNDKSIRQEETKRPGRFDLVYESDGREAIVGWIDHNRSMGEISQKAYDHIQDLSDDGCYIVRKGDSYAVRAYTEELGSEGKYLCLNSDDETKSCTFSDDKYTAFDSYEAASAASNMASRELGLIPSYDAPSAEDQDDYEDDIPSARDFDPHRDNGGCEHDMEGFSDEDGFFHPDSDDFDFGE